jgi:hypothetical protein
MLVVIPISLRADKEKKDSPKIEKKSSKFPYPQIQELYLNGKPTESLVFRAGDEKGLVFNVGHRLYFYHSKNKLSFKRTLHAPRGASLFDFGDINGDGYDDIGFFTGNLIVFFIQDKDFKFKRDKSREIPLQSILPKSYKDLNRIRLFSDLNLDGKQDIVFPGLNYFLIYNNLGDSFDKPYKLFMRFESTVSDRFWKNSDIRNNYFTGKVYTPKVYFKDLNQDNYPDFYCTRKNNLFLFMNNGCGKVKFLRSIRLPVSWSGVYGSYLSLHKINDDSYWDAILTIIKGSGISIRAENYLFPGKINFSLNTKKPLKYREDGGFFYPIPSNIPDKTLLLSPKIDIGIPFVISYLIQNKLRIRINQLQIINGVLQPISSNVLSYEVAGSLLPGFVKGDFTGDGFDEFAVGIDPENLHIYRAEMGKYYDSPLMKIRCKSYGILRVLELDGNGKEDIVITYPRESKKWKYKKNTVTILFF